MAKSAYPFPGMNPYLEHPVLWEPVHTRLVIEIADQLQPQLDPRYIASVEERVYVEGPRERKPDVWIERTREPSHVMTQPRSQGDAAVIIRVEELEIHQRRIEILDSYDEMKLIAVIELVSPSNKKSGPGRLSYEEKQQEILARECHFIEIDLIRNGTHVVSIPAWRTEELSPYDYLICVSRWPDRSQFELYPRSLREPLPHVMIPLVPPDGDIPLDLQSAVEVVYEKGRYGTRLRYDKPCVPPLSDEEQKWAWELLKVSQPQKPKRKRK